MKKYIICLRLGFLEIPHKNIWVSWGVLFKGLGVQKGTQTPCWLRLCLELRHTPVDKLNLKEVHITYLGYSLAFYPSSPVAVFSSVLHWMVSFCGRQAYLKLQLQITRINICTCMLCTSQLHLISPISRQTVGKQMKLDPVIMVWPTLIKSIFSYL